MILDYPLKDTTTLTSVETSVNYSQQQRQAQRQIRVVSNGVQIHLPRTISTLTRHTLACGQANASSSRSSSVENLTAMEDDENNTDNKDRLSGGLDMDVIDGIIDMIPGTMDEDVFIQAAAVPQKRLTGVRLSQDAPSRSFSTSVMTRLNYNYNSQNAHNATRSGRYVYHRHPVTVTTRDEHGIAQFSASPTPINIWRQATSAASLCGVSTSVIQTHNPLPENATRAKKCNIQSRNCISPATIWTNQNNNSNQNASEEENGRETAPLKAPRIITPSSFRFQPHISNITPAATNNTYSNTMNPERIQQQQVNEQRRHQQFLLQEQIQQKQQVMMQRQLYISHQQQLWQYLQQQRQEQEQFVQQQQQNNVLGLRQQQIMESDKENNNQNRVVKKRFNKEQIERRPFAVCEDADGCMADDDVSVISCDEENNSLNGDIRHRHNVALSPLQYAQQQIYNHQPKDGLWTITADDVIDRATIADNCKASGFPAPPAHFFSVGDIIGYSKVVRAERYEALGALNAAIGRFSDEWPEIRRGWEHNLRLATREKTNVDNAMPNRKSIMTDVSNAPTFVAAATENAT